MPEKIAKMFEEHFLSIAPAGVKVKVEYLHGGEAYVSPLDTPEYQAASMAVEETFGIKADSCQERRKHSGCFGF